MTLFCFHSKLGELSEKNNKLSYGLILNITIIIDISKKYEYLLDYWIPNIKNITKNCLILMVSGERIPKNLFVIPIVIFTKVFGLNKYNSKNLRLSS